MNFKCCNRSEQVLTVHDFLSEDVQRKACIDYPTVNTIPHIMQETQGLGGYH